MKVAFDPDAEEAEAAFVPAMELERHAPRAIVLGLFLALLLHATLYGYGTLMPPETKPSVARPPLALARPPIDIDVELASDPASSGALRIDVDETTISVPVPAVHTVPMPPAARRARPQDPNEPAAPAIAANAAFSAFAAPSSEPATSPPPPASVARLPPVRRGPDRSAAARLGGNVTWKCPWPPNADSEIHHMVVRAKASVRADGTPSAILILDDPGYGFGAAARLCGLRHTYIPARDAAGQPAEGETLPFSVYFDR